MLTPLITPIVKHLAGWLPGFVERVLDGLAVEEVARFVERLFSWIAPF